MPSRARLRRLVSVTIILSVIGVGRTARIAAQPPAPPKQPPPLWDVQLGASFVGASGNAETTSTGADFAAHRRGAIWQIESSAEAIRLSDHDTITAERYLGMLRGNRKLSPLLGVSAGEKLERDRFSGLDFRSVADMGLAWSLIRAPRWTLDGVSALAWEHENRLVGANRNDAAGVLQLLSRVPFGGSGDTTQRVTYYPDFTNTADYRVEAEIAAQAAMSDHLALKLGYLLRYAHEPVPGFKPTDNTTTASVVLRWKASTPAPQ